MPDISLHNDPMTIGLAVAELAKCGISPEQIRFNVVNKHPSLGEIVSQDPAPGVLVSLIDEVTLDVNSWSEHNGRRFSFFESEELLKAEQGLDEWQLEDWAEYKNFIVHVFARLDNFGELNHEHLLEKYIFTRVIPVQLDGFVCLNKMNPAISKEDLLNPVQWKMLCSDLRKSAVAHITPKGLAYIISKYLYLDASKIDCKFVDDKWLLTIDKKQKSQLDILRVKWLDYLFRPLNIQVEYKWKSYSDIPRPVFISSLKNVFLLKILEWIKLSNSLKHISVGNIIFVGTIVTILFYAYILTIGGGGYKITHKTQAKPPIVRPQKLTHHPHIKLIDGIDPIKAVKEGKRNAAYIADGKRYTPMTKSAAQGFIQYGIASWYGNEKSGLTVSNELYDPYALTAAHETLPIFCTVRITNLNNGGSINVKINDRGPFQDGRIINVSLAAAKKLNIIKEGTANVKIEVINIE